MLTQSQYIGYKFVGRLENIKTLIDGLRALSFGEDGMFQINEDGFRVTVEQGRVIQASLFILPAYFVDYHVTENVTFTLKLGVLIDCLSIFGSIECSLKILYKGDGAPLLLMLEVHDDEISTECSIKTITDEQPMDYQLDEDSPSLNVVFLRGPDLTEILHEMSNSVDEFKITISPKFPNFKIDAVGAVQSKLCMEVAKTSNMILLFRCRETTTAQYKAALIKLTHKALAVSHKVAIKTDKSGLLEMHFLMQSDEKSDLYVQFFLTPQLEDDDDV